MGDKRSEGFALTTLDVAARKEGRFGEALSLEVQIMKIVHDQKDPVHVADTLSRFALSLAHLGEPRAAAELVARSIAAYDELGTPVPTYQRPRNEQTMSLLRTQLEPRVLEEALEAGRRLSVDEAVELALGHGESAQAAEGAAEQVVAQIEQHGPE